MWHLDRPFDIAPDSGVRFTVEGLATLIEQTSAPLWAAGLRAGDRLAIIKDNHFDVVLLLSAAAARIGALPAMTSGTIEPEIFRRMMERLEPRVLVASPAVLAGAEKANVELVGSGCWSPAPAPGVLRRWTAPSAPCASCSTPTCRRPVRWPTTGR